MFSFGISTLFVSLIARSCVQASTTFESPFGLTFISTMAIASRFNGSGFIELSKHPLDARYQAIYQEALDVVDPLSFNLQDLTHVSVFQNAVKPVIESLRKRLGHEPEYAALLVPSTFRASLRDAAVEGVLVHEDAQRAFRQGWAREATCPGYGFLDGKNLGRRSEDCTEDGPVNLVVVLEYEKEYLHTWLMKVEFELETYPPIHSKFSRDCGERYIEVNNKQRNSAAYHVIIQADGNLRGLATRATKTDWTSSLVASSRRLCNGTGTIIHGIIFG